MRISNISILKVTPCNAFCKCVDQNIIPFECEGTFNISISRFDKGLFEDEYVFEVSTESLSENFSDLSISLNGNDSTIIRYRSSGDYTVSFSLKFNVDVNAIRNNPQDGRLSFKIISRRNNNISECVGEIIINYPNSFCDDCGRCSICTIEPAGFVYSDDTCNSTNALFARVRVDENARGIQPSITEVIYGENVLGCYNMGTENNGIYPIHIDINQIEYPRADIKIKARVNCGITEFDIENTIDYVASPFFNKMYVEFRERDNFGVHHNEMLYDGILVTLPDVYLDAGGQITKNIVIRNLATQTNQAQTGVRIRNVRKEIDVPSDRIAGDINYLNTFEANEEVVQCNDEHIISVIFDLNVINDVVVSGGKRFVDAKLKVSFEYKEDRFSQQVLGVGLLNDGEWRRFECTFRTRIYGREPHRWYSVDFGTSAVVAYTGNPRDNRDIPTPIDLKQKKINLIQDNYPEQPEIRRDQEQPSNLISSTLYLNPTGKDDAECFKDKKVWFSPARGMVNQLYQLPCLKYMVGNEMIPRIDLSENDRRNLPTRIEDIMNNAYDQLCTNYLNDNQIRAMVFTVPNTFTPLHIANIRNILMDKIPTLADEYLEFISESDAVLCLYLNKRVQLLNSIGGNANLHHREREHILVYDMGAGTLDLTYAECQYDRNNNYRVSSVDIKGRMGINKAGNYIDYLLGLIIVDLLVSKCDVSRDDVKIESLNEILTLEPQVGVDYGQRRLFKDYLCNKVKTILNESYDTSLPPIDNNRYQIGFHEYGELAQITIGDIKGHALFVDYVRNCTVDVITDFASLYGTNQAGIGPKLKLDYIFISGRSVSIKAIRDSLVHVIGRVGWNDLFRPINAICNDVNNDNIGSKIAVAQGALDYVKLSKYTRNFNISKKRVYGTYGLLVQRGDVANSQWIPLIDHNTNPVNNVLHSNKQVDCNNVVRISLCHTYKLNPTVDVMQRNYDSTVILHNYDMPAAMAQAHQNININFEISDANVVSYSVGPTVIQLQSHDDYYNESLRKSLWPVVYC